MGELMHLIEIVGLSDDTVEIVSFAPFSHTPRKMRIGTTELMHTLTPHDPRARARALLILLGGSNEGDSEDELPHEFPRTRPGELSREPLGIIDIGVEDTLPSQLLQLIANMVAPNVRVHPLWSLHATAAPSGLERHRSFDLDIAAEEEGGSNEGGSDDG